MQSKGFVMNSLAPSRDRGVDAVSRRVGNYERNPEHAGYAFDSRVNQAAMMGDLTG